MSWLEGLEKRGCLGDRIISSLSHWSTETERYYLITAFHAAYMRTSKHLDEVFAFFVQSSAFAVDAREQFKEEIDAQIKQCEDEAAKLPAHARARVDALLAAEVLVGVKHHIFEGSTAKGSSRPKTGTSWARASCSSSTIWRTVGSLPRPSSDGPRARTNGTCL